MEDIKNEGAPASTVTPGAEGVQQTGAAEQQSPLAEVSPDNTPKEPSAAVSPHVLQTISTTEPSVHETGIPMTAERISVDENPLPQHQHPNDVRFKVKYRKDFDGAKSLPEGSIQVVAKESAEHFTKLGMGSIIK